MSRLDGLIQELCPDGVEYKPFCDVTYMSAGERITKANMSEDGMFPAMGAGIVPTGRYDDWNRENCITISRAGAGAGSIGWHPEKFWATDVCFTAEERKEIAQIKYVYYAAMSSEKELKKHIYGGSMPKIDKAYLWKLPIPVPPVTIQQEIVRVLDRYTECSLELIERLSEELTARKQQYEYYRDQMFDSDEYEGLSIAQIAQTNIGLATSVTKHKRERGVILLHNSDIQQNHIALKNVEFISEEFAEKNSSKILHKGDIITVHTGDVGTSAVINDEFDGSIGFTTITTRIKDKARILPQYLCHYLNSSRCKRDIASMTISDRSNLNQSSFEKLIIPIPTIERQKTIIHILDRLNNICNDIYTDLSTEITARQKQYEHYRDGFLTFKENNV